MIMCKELIGRQYTVTLDGRYLLVILEALTLMRCKECAFNGDCGLEESYCSDIREAIRGVINARERFKRLNSSDIVEDKDPDVQSGQAGNVRVGGHEGQGS